MVKKHFLFPEIVRRGDPVMVFVVREPIKPKKTVQLYDYWLGVYHDFIGRGKPAEVTDYHSVSRQRISKRFYDSLVAESKANARRYRPGSWRSK